MLLAGAAFAYSVAREGLRIVLGVEDVDGTVVLDTPDLPPPRPGPPRSKIRVLPFVGLHFNL